jgi:hypothetical protein
VETSGESRALKVFMSIVVAALLLISPSQRIDPMAISTLIDRSFKGAEWKRDGWIERSGKGPSMEGSFSRGDELAGKAKIVQYHRAGFWESLPPRRVIALASKEVLHDSGKDWGIWLLDMSDSERSAADYKPTQTLVMLKFFYKNVGGHLNVKSFKGRGHLPSDRRLTLSILTKTYKELKTRFQAGEK